MPYANNSYVETNKRKYDFRAEIRPVFLMLGIVVSGGIFSTEVIASKVDISTQAHQQIRSYLYRDVARFAGSIGSNDFRIDLDKSTLSDCDTPFEISRNKARPPTGKVTLTVECHHPKYWKSRVKAEVRVYQKIVVAKHTIERDQVLTANDFKRRRTDISYVRQGYFTTFNELDNQVSKRRITVGKIISPRMVEFAKWVERHQEVVIEARIGGMAARMKGVALESGSKGEQIKVKNSTSDKTILATVVGPKKVQTLF